MRDNSMTTQRNGSQVVNLVDGNDLPVVLPDVKNIESQNYSSVTPMMHEDKDGQQQDHDSKEMELTCN